MGTRYGVQILWPVLLVQHRMLRVSLGYLDHAKRHQAITYALEAVIEEGLREDFGSQGQAVIDLWQRLDPVDPAMFDRLDSRTAIRSEEHTSELQSLMRISYAVYCL